MEKKVQTKIVDPVCGMILDTNNKTISTKVDREEYFFCCKECQNNFTKNPEHYITRNKREST